MASFDFLLPLAWIAVAVLLIAGIISSLIRFFDRQAGAAKPQPSQQDRSART